MKNYRLFLSLISISLFSSSCERLLIQSDTDFPYETAQFSADYVQKNEGRIAFETPELYELMKVAISFTDYSKANPGNITNTQSAYFREMQSQFQDYKSHTLIQKLNDRIKSTNDDYKYRDNSYGFEFDKNNKVVSRNIYPFVGGGLYAKNLFKELIPDLEDFAEKTKFRAFYQSRQAFYEGLIAYQSVVMPAKKMQNWLEARFPARYNSLKIVFSPLTGGNHQTVGFETPNFKEILMFVSFADFDKNKYTAKQIEGLASRIVFTEIDHNYVNPMTEKYRDNLKTAMPDWKTWNNPNGPSKSYNSSTLTFNEYMTWGVFTLYAVDNFNKTDFEIINQDTELWMRNRGFNKFTTFNKEILRVYTENPKITVDDLYLKMFEWMKKQG